jgi:hypothetical protein
LIPNGDIAKISHTADGDKAKIIIIGITIIANTLMIFPVLDGSLSVTNLSIII